MITHPLDTLSRRPFTSPSHCIHSHSSPSPTSHSHYSSIHHRGLTDATKREHSCWDTKDGGLIANSAIYDALSGHLLNDPGARVHLENEAWYDMNAYNGILKSLKERQNRRKFTNTPSSNTFRDGMGHEQHALATSHKESKTPLQEARSREKAVADSKKLLYWVAMHGYSQIGQALSPHPISTDHIHDEAPLSTFLSTLEQDIIEEKNNGTVSGPPPSRRKRVALTDPTPLPPSR